jgi:hypothetical protein
LLVQAAVPPSTFAQSAGVLQPQPWDGEMHAVPLSFVVQSASVRQKEHVCVVVSQSIESSPAQSASLSQPQRPTAATHAVP